MTVRSLVLATRNEHKLTEFARLMTSVAIEPLADGIELPPEHGTTFAENAIAKARAAAAATRRPSIADDSGIEATALNGAPGVYSARYAGPDASDQENLDKLLREAPAGSRVTYVCVLAHVEPSSGEERLFEGRCAGRMAATPRGSGGFGYDPVFVPDAEPSGRTMAELSPAEKDAVSHRGRAARALEAWLRDRAP